MNSFYKIFILLLLIFLSSCGGKELDTKNVIEEQDIDLQMIAAYKEGKEALEKGFEGLMIKPNDNYYECKRSHAWLKINPFIEVTLKIIDIQEGTGKHSGKLGAFHVEGDDDGKFYRRRTLQLEIP